MQIFSDSIVYISLSEIIIKSLLIILAALTFIWFMRRASAAARHLFLAVIASALLVLPLTTLMLPAWNFAFFPNPAGAVNTEESSGLIISSGPISEDVEKSSERESLQKGGPGIANIGQVSLLDSLIVLWVAGTVGLLVWLLSGKMYGSWITRSSSPVTNVHIINKFSDCVDKIGIKRSVKLLISDKLKVPAVAGYFGPKLILPSYLRDWSLDRMESIFIHELAHIKRNDVLVQLLAQISSSIYWWNPLIWILERKLLIERERACDDMVLRHNIKTSDYAEHLMDVLEEMGNKGNKIWALTAMAEGTDFKDRILSVLNPAASRTSPKLLQTILITVVTFLVLLPVSAFKPWASKINIESSPATEFVSDDSNQSRRDDKLAKALETVLNDPDPDLREEAAGALGRLRNVNAVPGLITALLEDNNARVREHAAEALAAIGDRRAVPALIEAMNDNNARVREHVAEALGIIANGNAYDVLSRSIRNDSSTSVRAHSATALGRLGNRRAFPLLIETMNGNDDVSVRAEAAYGLGLLNDKRAVPSLCEALSDTSATMRLAAAMALKLTGDESALDALNIALNDQSSDVRRAAAEAITEIKQRDNK